MGMPIDGAWYWTTVPLPTPGKLKTIVSPLRSTDESESSTTPLFWESSAFTLMLLVV